jgi:ribonuclease BN (tRNA processing enzyme)
MKLTVIGCGNAFSNLNYNQSFLLEEGSSKMLVDCGQQISRALHDQKIDLNSITDVYITHAHSDHISSLAALSFQRYDWMNKPHHYSEGNYAPRLIANEKLMEDLWNHSLKGGLNSMEGFDATLETFFETKPIKANEEFEWEGWTVKLIQQVHVLTGSVIMPSFGLFFEKKGHQSLFLTTDAQYFQPEQVGVFYEKADIIIQDCECIGVDTVAKNLDFKSGVHANYGQLAGNYNANSMVLSEDIKKKLYLSHYQDFVTEGKDYKGNTCDWQLLANTDGFAGFVYVGMEMEI